MSTLTCPKCQGDMRSYERNGVTVDQCASCRGIFLDRGELEHLMDAETRFNAPPSPPRYEQHPQQHQKSYQQPYKKRKKSIFEELFD